MRLKDVYMLDKEDEKAVELFVKLGMPKNLAKTLLCISKRTGRVLCLTTIASGG